MQVHIMSAGPTSVHEDVVRASQKPLRNTDLDRDYVLFQRKTEKKISQLLQTDAQSFIMLGEAMLGLDGAMASLIEPGDRVLVISNGVFGEGFHDMARRYGAETVSFSGDLRRGISLTDLEEFLKKDAAFKLATFVHCETPSGITNDVHGIGQLLHQYGILSVVDSVSSMGGERFNFDEAKVDVAIGGTQKCLSALTGLTLITLSEGAIACMQRRKVPVAGFYANFENYLCRNDGFDFPYTQSDTLVMALDEALNRTLSTNFVVKHEAFANRTREFLRELGYELYAKDSYSNTVSTVLLKEHQNTDHVLKAMHEKGFMISGAMGELEGKAIRIGHMGHNIEDEAFYESMLNALKDVLNQKKVEHRGPNVTDLQIRPWKEEDLETLVSLAGELWPEHTPQTLRQEFEPLLRDPEAVFFVAQGETLCGFAQCQLRHDYVEGTSSSPVGYLEGLYVTVPYRRQGVATALVEACEVWAREKGCAEFGSDTLPEYTQSIAFHTKRGFNIQPIITFNKKL